MAQGFAVLGIALGIGRLLVCGLSHLLPTVVKCVYVYVCLCVRGGNHSGLYGGRISCSAS